MVLALVDVAHRVIALVEDMVPHLLPIATLMRIEHHLLFLGELPGSVLVIWVLFFVGPCVVYGDGGRCDWRTTSGAQIIDPLDSESNRLLPLISCVAPCWVLCGHDVVLVADFDVFKRYEWVVFEFLILRLYVHVTMPLNVIVSIFRPDGNRLIIHSCCRSFCVGPT